MVGGPAPVETSKLLLSARQSRGSPSVIGGSFWLGSLTGLFQPRPRAISVECRYVLFLTVLFGVRLHGLFGVTSSMTCMAAGGVSMVRGFFVVSRRVMLCSFLVMTGRMRVMFRSLLMVFCSFL